MGHEGSGLENGLGGGSTALVLLAPPDGEEELDMATVEELHAAQTRIETKVDHVLASLDALRVAGETRSGDIQGLRDRVIVLEERQRAEEIADKKTEEQHKREEEHERWAKIEQWVVRIAAAVGVAGAGAHALGF